MPRVINLRDTSGYCPTGAVRIDRKTKWGNPFRIGLHGDRHEVIRRYTEWILTQEHLLLCLGELRGKDLACWCCPDECHGDILLVLANYPEVLAA